ncbi:DUF6122 family protein [Mesonia aestuariivivens]|uniref:Metal-dependent hydrolase n=1 Tax=Mesonia aestuariivivens TaxID=2796128 RepID=A0ABS6W2T3_9FLAO|nr:DUF6122 family protein [Mesonia aestuariivivens]MBW2962124.1 hypothetical protein [Mesonia aestuariivivens]
MLQNFTHYFLHFIAIGGIAYLYDKTNWKMYWLILVATMLVDVDHVLADPIFQPQRCSINFHLLHTYYAITIYCLGAILIKHKIVRLICIGLCFHMFTDKIDCLWNNFG